VIPFDFLINWKIENSYVIPFDLARIKSPFMCVVGGVYIPRLEEFSLAVLRGGAKRGAPLNELKVPLKFIEGPL